MKKIETASVDPWELVSNVAGPKGMTTTSRLKTRKGYVLRVSTTSAKGVAEALAFYPA